MKGSRCARAAELRPLRRFSNRPVAESVQRGEPIASTTRGTVQRCPIKAWGLLWGLLTRSSVVHSSSVSSSATRSRASALPIMVMVIAALAGASCSQRLIGDNGVACTVGLQMDGPAVVAACGLPNGLMEQPKIGGGSWFSFEMCSAPAYIYEKEAVLFGCDGTVDGVTELLADSYQGMIAAPTRYLLDDIERGGTHLAARIAQLQHQEFRTEAEHLRLEQVLRDAESSSDPLVRRAAKRVRDSRRIY